MGRLSNLAVGQHSPMLHCLSGIWDKERVGEGEGVKKMGIIHPNSACPAGQTVSHFQSFISSIWEHESGPPRTDLLPKVLAF